MKGAEVVHGVLQVPHVAEEVFRGLPRWLDRAWRGDRRAVESVWYGIWLRRRRMSDKVGWNEDEEECSDEG